MKIAGPLVFQPEPLVTFVDKLASGGQFSQPGNFEQVTWGAPTSVATADWMNRAPVSKPPNLADLGFLPRVESSPVALSAPPAVLDLAALSI